MGFALSKCPHLHRAYVVSGPYSFSETVCLLFRTKDVWKSVEKLEGLTVDILSLWQQKEIDVIIAPGFVFPAPPVKHPARLVPAVSYTAAYNVLDFPVGSLPITRVIPQDEVSLYTI